jgi:hypothetical protein
MNIDDKKKMLEKLNKAHSDIKEVISEENMSFIVFAESEWRIRDLLGHIATWDQEVIKSLKAFLKGESYLIVDLDDDESDFNGLAVQEQRKLSDSELLNEWNSTQDDLALLLDEIPLDKFSVDFEYPWGDENGSVQVLIGYMIDHKCGHLEEILKVLSKAKS